MQHAGFEQVGFHFVPVDIGQHVPVDLDTRRKAPPALFEHLSVVERIVDDIPIFRRAGCDFSQNGADALAPAAVWFQVRSDFLFWFSG